MNFEQLHCLVKTMAKHKSCFWNYILDSNPANATYELFDTQHLQWPQ